jgi:tripartite ATP-independent transporter DctM subunit
MIWVAVALATLLSIGAPVFVAMGLSGAVGLWAENQMQILVATKLFTGMDSFVLLAGPFFILAGEIMSRCGLTERLIRLSFLITRRIRGGTAYSAVGAAVILSGVSGTAVGDAAALGSIFVREMPKEGYTKDYSAGLVIACSMLGPIIPPSVIMVIYAAITQVNIIDLFVAGIVPGLLIAAALAITIFIGGVRGALPRPQNRIQPGEMRRLIWEGLVVLSLPVVVIRGAVAGVFTATEAGGLAAVYAAFLGFVVFRSLTPRSLVDALVATAKISAALYLILGASEILSYVVIVTGLDEYINALAALFAGSPTLFLFAIALFFLVIGTFLEPGPAVLLFIPLLLPTVSELGVDPLQFALVVLLTLTLGLITPPVGVCMFVVGRIANLGTGRLTKAVLPFFVAELAVVVLLCAFPVLSSGLPKLLR